MEAPVQKALEVVGDRNRYQYIAFTLLFVYNGFSNLMMVGPTFIFMNPLFRCPGFDQLVDESQACSIIETCSISSQPPTQSTTSQSLPRCDSTAVGWGTATSSSSCYWLAPSWAFWWWGSSRRGWAAKLPLSLPRPRGSWGWRVPDC